MHTANTYFLDFAAHFVGAQKDQGGDIVMPELLDRKKLDYSVESLREVDRYLLQLHERQSELSGKDISRTLIWGGAYLGEVIRRNAQVTFRWVDYNDYVAAYPEVVPLVGPRAVPTYAFLCRDNGAMNVPIGKVLKCLQNGAADSVHFHAMAELERQHS